MDIDYRLAFEAAPVGLVISRNRTMIDCNRQVCEMFEASREVLIGQTFQILYPSADEYERLGARIAPILNGYRGKPAANIDALVNVVTALQQAVVGSSVVEVELNPVLATTTSAIAVDALLIEETK